MFDCPVVGREVRRSVSLVILGIDPGLANTGWAILECEGDRMRSRCHGCITTDSKAPVAVRLRQIFEGIGEVVDANDPDECAIEEVYFSNNAKTAFATGQARGVALLACADMPVGEYGPGEVKLGVTGYGAAGKEQVTYMVRTMLGLSEDPKPDHAADAIAVAVCHASGRGMREAAAAAGGSP
jgi:crossover junction endodeoxyribonuclease RuvC